MWFFLALVAAALFATINFIDKYLLSEVKLRPVSLAIFSSYFGGLIGITIIITSKAQDVIFPEISQLLLLIAAGVATTLFVWAYLTALDTDETSIVSPLFLTSVIFTYFLGVYYLNEVIETQKIIGASVVLAGSILLGFRSSKEKRKMRIKFKTFFLMTIAGFFLSVNATIFKYVADKQQVNFWTSVFWEHVGLAIGGFVLIISIILLWPLIKLCRLTKTSLFETLSFRHIFERGFLTFSANGINEVLNTVGFIIINFIILSAPVALVFTIVESFQPFFVILYGIVLSFLFPKVFSESGGIKVKLIATIIMAAGTYLVLI